MVKSIIYILLFIKIAFAQTIIPEKEIGNFSNAGAFAFSPIGFIYVTDLEKDEVYKIDSTGKELQSIGGYGWGSSSFDAPVDIFANPLHVYVTDKNNNRIQIFDKDLNFLSSFEGENVDDPDHQFAYPLSAAISPLGDFFILDSDNKRILKYNLSGDFVLEFGNYNSGDFALVNPTKMSISPNANIYVIDGNKIVIFDQFGGGLTKIKLDFEPTNIDITQNYVSINNDSILEIINLKDRNNPQKIKNHFSEKIVEAAIYKNMLYVLTPKSILVNRIIFK